MLRNFLIASCAFAITAAQCWHPAVARQGLKPKPSDPNMIYARALTDRLYSVWEPTKGSIKTQVACFETGPHGIFRHIQVRLPDEPIQAKFACVEAMSEISALPISVPTAFRPGAHIEFKLEKAQRKNFIDCAERFKKHNKVATDEVVWHLIPVEALNCVKGLKPSTVHCDNNLRILKAAHVNSPDLIKARAEWSIFLHQKKNISVAELQSKSKDIEQRYKEIMK